MSISDKAKEVIEQITYINLATVSKEHLPWNTAVCFGYDNDYNFYWASDTMAQHSQNLASNSKVFLSIYDSTRKPGTNARRGVFIQAKAFTIDDTKEINYALKCLYRRIGEVEEEPKEFLGEYPRRMYKAVPEKVWVNVHGERNGKYVDAREQIKLI
jgi:nitroimidazol reductase NimA-like FMN-containing flavoprotein (pyridoxamine 5'-phosphate oxidase superfamily)